MNRIIKRNQGDSKWRKLLPNDVSSWIDLLLWFIASVIFAVGLWLFAQSIVR